MGLGGALLALATAASPTASSSLRVVALNHVLSLTPTPAHVEAMGGLAQVWLRGAWDCSLSLSHFHVWMRFWSSTNPKLQLRGPCI